MSFTICLVLMMRYRSSITFPRPHNVPNSMIPPKSLSPDIKINSFFSAYLLLLEITAPQNPKLHKNHLMSRLDNLERYLLSSCRMQDIVVLKLLIYGYLLLLVFRWEFQDHIRLILLPFLASLHIRGFARWDITSNPLVYQRSKLFTSVACYQRSAVVSLVWWKGR